MSGLYILDAQGQPQPVADVLEWGRWFDKADRAVARTHLQHCLVSTVFLGLDHGFGFLDGRPPVLWETMAFWKGDGGNEVTGVFDRYSTLTAAKKGHENAVRIATEMEQVAVEGSKQAFDALMCQLTGGRR